MNPQALQDQAARKQVTVLFCDVVDYTSRANSMDPEDLADEIRIFQTLCWRIAEKYHGHIWNFLGDGVMVVFGHPIASEFDPEHAIRVSLEIKEEIEQNNASFEWRNRHPIEVRMGIATSLVVLGEKAGKKRDQDALIFGEAPNLAARLQELAKPNSVVTSLRTRRLVGSAFKFKDLGEFTLKGFANPVAAWELQHESSLLSRHYGSLRRVTTRFVSRESELRTLMDNYEIAIQHNPRFIYLVGEAGIGKSRLLRVFEKTLKSQDIHRVRVSCSPYYESTPLKSVIDEIYHWIQADPADDNETIQNQVRASLNVLGIKDNQRIALFCDLLNLGPPSDIDPLKSSAEQKHYQTIRFLAELVFGLTRTKPVMVVVEDLHWADPSTLELLEYISRNINQRALFFIATARPEFKSLGRRSDSTVVVNLDRLDYHSSSKLVSSVFRNVEIPADVAQKLIEKAAGIPLYLEECSWHLLSQMQEQSPGDDIGKEFSIPDTLQDSLNARLDRLGTAKQLAQLAATFSNFFTYSKIRQIADQNDIDADDSMDVLLQAGLLKRIPNADEDRYIFEHILFQEAAYNSLLRKTRQRYHQQIADLYVSEDPRIIDIQPELIAFHYGRTEQIELAFDLWMKAAQLAITKSAFAEAIDHIEHGSHLLTELPKANLMGDDTAIDIGKPELQLLSSLAVCLTVKSGYNGNKVNQTYHRCIELANDVGNAEQQWSALYGFWRCLICQGEFGKSLGISVQLKRLSDSLDNRTLRMTSLGIQAMSRQFAGKFQSAEQYFNSSLSNYDSIEDRNIGIKFGQDPYVTIQGLFAVNQLILNDYTNSKLEIEKSVDVARSIGHPYTIAETLRLAAMYEQINRDMVALQRFASEAVKISEEFGFDGLLAASRIFLAFCDVVTYQSHDAIEVIKHELVQYKENFGLLFYPYFQGLLAEAYLYMNRYEEAFTESSHVLLLIEKYGEVWPQVPVMLIRAESAARGKLTEETTIRRWYEEAREVAEKQNADLFLERVSVSGDKFEDSYTMPLNTQQSSIVDSLAEIDHFSENVYKI